MQIIGDHLLGVVLEGEEADVAEEGLEDGGPDVRPVEHPLELRGVLHVALQRGEEDLGRVGENDDSEADGKVGKVEGPLHLRPTPVADLEEAVGKDDGVDEDVGHCAPEGEDAHTLQRFEKA